MIMGITFLLGCKVYNNNSFNGFHYRTEHHHMLGFNSITFRNDSFFIKERDGQFFSYGIFRTSNVRKEIYLVSVPQRRLNDLSVIDSVFVDYSGSPIVIKNKKTILLKGQEYKRKVRNIGSVLK